MTFSKLSQVCGAGSRGQAEMLQQIYSLVGGGVKVRARAQNVSSLAKPELAQHHPALLGAAPRRCRGPSLQGERGLSALLSSSRQSETGPLKDEVSGAFTRDMLCQKIT